MSTKGNDNVTAAGGRLGESVSPLPGFLTRTRLAVAGLSGYARVFEARSDSAGAILRFARVRPPQSGPFQPLKAHEITPKFLDRAVRAIRRWNYDIVPIAEAIERAGAKPAAKRFVCLTFDGGSRDQATHAYPVLARHAVPFTVYLPTGSVDGVGETWWLALEQVIARHSRISLMMDRDERRFTVAGLTEKHELYDYLSVWLRALPPAELSATIADLCKRYGVDLGAISRDFAMNWDDVARLAADPLATIGTATVHGSMLAGLSSADAAREIKMGRAVAEAALSRSLPHLAYPFGEQGTCGQREALLAGDAGFATAATLVSGTISRTGTLDPLKLPRIAWDGRVTSLRVLRAMLAGLV